MELSSGTERTSEHQHSLMGANGNKKIILPNTIFGKWVVLGESEKRYNRNSYYLCRCVCGMERLISGTDLRTGRTTQCMQCSIPARTNTSSFHNTTGDIPGSVLTRLKYGASKRNIVVDITMEDLWNLWLNQEMKCALTGELLKLPRVGGDSTATASVDRIDSSIGYVLGNIQWVHKSVNLMKLDHDEDVFFEWCRKIVDYKDETKRLRGSRPWLKGGSSD